MPRKSKAELELERIREANRAKTARWREAHPDANRRYASRHAQARNRLRELYPAEFEAAQEKLAAEGVRGSAKRDKAHVIVRDAHPDEWREILAQTP